MGLAASQAKFLAVTARKVDLEFRMQEICNNRLRLANEMDKVADQYNREISDRRLYTNSMVTPYERISFANLYDNGYQVFENTNNTNKIFDVWTPVEPATTQTPYAGDYSELTNTSAIGSVFYIGDEAYQVTSFTDEADTFNPIYEAPTIATVPGTATVSHPAGSTVSDYILQPGETPGVTTTEGEIVASSTVVPNQFNCSRTDTVTTINVTSAEVPEVKQTAPAIVSSTDLTVPSQIAQAEYYEELLTTLAENGVDTTGVQIVKYKADKISDPNNNGDTQTIALRFDSKTAYNNIVEALNTTAPQTMGGAGLTKPVDQIKDFTYVREENGFNVYSYTDRNGVETTAYGVATVNDLKRIGDSADNMNKNYILMGDIDLNGVTSDVANQPIIYNASASFSGMFDGNGYTIDNLSGSSGTNLSYGLFDTLNGATIKNVSMKDVDITSDNQHVGAIAGEATNSFIDNCFASGDVAGDDGIGGLIGIATGCTITDSGADVDINKDSLPGAAGYGYNGGLVGQANNTNIDNCYANGDVRDDGRYIGGLVGHTSGTSSITNSYATGDVTGTTGDADTVGGLIGYNQSTGDITNVYATGNVTSVAKQIGGLIGYNMDNGSDITNAHATGNVSGTSDVGGLIGWNGTNNTLTDVYATGTVNGTTQVGGLVGENRADIIGAYYTGASVTGNGNQVGGLIGQNGWDSTLATITNAYAITNVSNASGEDTGGLIGLNGDGDTITNVYHEGTVTGNGRDVGGLIGENRASAVTDAYHDGVVTNLSAADATGGLIGWNNNSTENISNVYALGDVTSNGSWVGGLMGSTYSSTTNAYHIGDVTGTGGQIGGLMGSNGWNGGSGHYVASLTNVFHDGNVTNLGTGDHTGGLTGITSYNAGTIIDNAYVIGDVTSGGSKVGGISGVAYNDILNTYHSGNVTGSGSYIAGVVGYYYDSNMGSMTNVYHDGGDVTNLGTGTYTGGLIGEGELVSITNSYADGNVSSQGTYVGGLVGNNYATVDTVYHTGNVSGNGSYVAGLIGYNQSTGQTVTDAYHIGTVSNSDLNADNTAGLIGWNGSTNDLTRVYAQGDVIVSSDGTTSGTAGTAANFTAGLVGDNYSDITDAYHTGNIYAGGNYIGGLIGYNRDHQTTVTNAFADGNVTNDYTSGQDTGGLIGHNNVNGALTNVYADGDVAGGTDVGGLVGENHSTITNYSQTGTSTGVTRVADPVGYNPSSYAVTGAGLDNVLFNSTDVAQADVTTVSVSQAAIDASVTAPVISDEIGASFPEYDLEFVLDEGINLSSGVDAYLGGNMASLDFYSQSNIGAVTGWTDTKNTNPVTQEYEAAAYEKVITYNQYDWVETVEASNTIRHFEAVKVESTDDAISGDDLEARLRSGQYKLISKTNNQTENPVYIDGQAYEVNDWRTISIIHDDLYEGNDQDAQARFEANVKSINYRDKKLELEQQKIDTEYKAITTERQTIEKLITKNTESSFKIFS